MQNTVISYLENTVRQYPDKVAVQDKESTCTFEELRKVALCISTAIFRRIQMTKQPIFVYLPKSVRSIQAFMGVLYSGNFYTPTDVNFPFEKANSIMKCLEPALILSDTKHASILESNGVDSERILNLDEISFDAENASFVCTDIIDTDVAYILFTSGSTGVPKGVVISHRSIIDYIDWAKECFRVNEKDTIGNQAPFYFDNSTLDIYLMLSTGATLQIVPEGLFAFPAKLMEYVQAMNINTIFWVPSVFINVANMDILSRMDCSCLKKILFAGEVMPNKHLNYWRKHIKDAVYANLYGPTEITVDCTYYLVDREFADDEPLPIGVPCVNSNVMLLDDEGRLIEEANLTGELCVRGTSLALGYWNNWDKTNEVFVQNPLNKAYPEKIYCTGDLAHYNEFGEIMFDGRKDFQIKHMGYRIELGEIETMVLGLEEIKEACVLYDSDNREIVLCYVGLEMANKQYIRRCLMNKLPKYMIPTKYIQMEVLPKNDNGKIDRKVLFGEIVGK